MADKLTPSSKRRFLEGAKAWINAEAIGNKWEPYWLNAPCCLLEYAREVNCRFDKESETALKGLEAKSQDEHATAASNLFGRYTQKVKDPKAVYRQAALLMESMIHGVRAAMALGPCRDGGPPQSFIKSAIACFDAYNQAWPIGGGVVQEGALHSPKNLAANTDRVAKALQWIVKNHPRVSGLPIATWLAVRRLIDYVLGGNEPAASESVEASMLLYLDHVKARGEDEGEGIVRTVNVYKRVEGHFGYYLDPVVLGLVHVDQTMIDSLDLAWRACRPELQKGLGDRGVALPAIRLSPDLSGGGNIPGVWQLSGGSAGGLMACAMYAAATDTRLNTDASASVVLCTDDDSVAPDSELDISRIGIQEVSEESVGPKLRAAKGKRIRRVVLKRAQATWAQKLSLVPAGLTVVPASNLAEVYEALTGDAKIERVLAACCKRTVEHWNACRTNPRDPDKLIHHVEPHYLVQTEGSDEDGFEHTGDMIEERYKRLEEEIDSPREQDPEPRELAMLLRRSMRGGVFRLCMIDDAGAGKSVFTRRLAAFLCSPEGQRLLESLRAAKEKDAVPFPRPYLVVRFERHELKWPDFDDSRLAEALAQRVETMAGEPLRDVPTDKEQTPARKAVDWALEHGRVVLLLDALDQVRDNQPIESLERFLNDSAGFGNKSHVALTSRDFEVSRRLNTLFRAGTWEFVRLLGLTLEQQYLYLKGDVVQEIPEGELADDPEDREWQYRQQLEVLFPDYDEVAELLQIPVVLSFIRTLHEEKKLQPFRSRGELYSRVTVALLNRAFEKTEDSSPDVEQMELWQKLLGAAAYQMMVGEHYDLVVTGNDLLNMRRWAAERIGLGRSEATKIWRDLERVSSCTNRCLLQGSTTEFFGFRHHGMMEYYCGWYLANNWEGEWVKEPREAGDPPIRCGDKDLARFANDEKWNWAFRFAIELAPSLSGQRPKERKILTASLAELFMPREKGQGRRPTELIYRAWPLFEVDRFVLRERGLTEQEGRKLLLPGAEQVMKYFRQTGGKGAKIIEAMKGNPSRWCPARQALKGWATWVLTAVSGELLRPRAPRRPFIGCPPTGLSTEFWMGSPKGEDGRFDDEGPRHRVQVPQFEMQATPTTRGQYRVFDPNHEVIEASAFREYSRADDCPVIKVSWYDAFAFSKWLGAEYRLPTEAEWEFACRAGTKTVFGLREGGQNSLTSQDANFDGDHPYPAEAKKGPSLGRTQPVGSYDPNTWGLQDMHGNVWEWCWDWHDPGWYAEQQEAHGSGAAPDEGGPTAGTSRVLRGGSFNNVAEHCRSAFRNVDRPLYGYDDFGFRVVRCVVVGLPPSRPR